MAVSADAIERPAGRGDHHGLGELPSRSITRRSVTGLRWGDDPPSCPDPGAAVRGKRGPLPTEADAENGSLGALRRRHDARAAYPLRRYGRGSNADHGQPDAPRTARPAAA